MYTGFRFGVLILLLNVIHVMSRHVYISWSWWWPSDVVICDQNRGKSDSSESYMTTGECTYRDCDCEILSDMTKNSDTVYRDGWSDIWPEALISWPWLRPFECYLTRIAACELMSSKKLIANRARLPKKQESTEREKGTSQQETDREESKTTKKARINRARKGNISARNWSPRECERPLSIEREALQTLSINK